MRGHAQEPAVSYRVGRKIQAPVVRAVGVGRSIRVHVHSGMKKDGISNLLRRKRLCSELNISRLMAGAGILLRLGGDDGTGVKEDTSGSQCELRQLLHDRGSSVLSTVLASKETSVRNILLQQHLPQ